MVSKLAVMDKYSSYSGRYANGLAAPERTGGGSSPPDSAIRNPRSVLGGFRWFAIVIPPGKHPGTSGYIRPWNEFCTAEKSPRASSLLLLFSRYGIRVHLREAGDQIRSCNLQFGFLATCKLQLGRGPAIAKNHAIIHGEGFVGRLGISLASKKCSPSETV